VAAAPSAEAPSRDIFREPNLCLFILCAIYEYRPEAVSVDNRNYVDTFELD
jgi:hypothetical protein